MNKPLYITFVVLLICVLFSCQNKPRNSTSEKVNAENTLVSDTTIVLDDTTDLKSIERHIYSPSDKIIKLSLFLAELSDSNINYIIIRKLNYIQDSTEFTNYLGVNTNTLETKLFSAENLQERNWDYLIAKHQNSNYVKLYLYAKELNDGKTHNSGLKNLSNSECYTITTDLCPSTCDFEYDFYENINAAVEWDDSIALPIGIAVSGGWILTHANELNWLIEKENIGKFSITWINHSYYHRYVEDEPTSNNYFLIEDTNVENEILYTEKTMLQNGLIPSIYFRFPGLVSDEQLYSKVMSFGLMPLGADSWIANGKFPKRGSTVLLHGNGNEPNGIVMFLDWLSLNQKQLCIASINQLCINHFRSNTREIKNKNSG